MKTPSAPHPKAPEPGSRLLALEVLASVLDKKQGVDEALAFHGNIIKLDARDRNFARLMVMTVLRRLGQIDAVLTKFVSNPIPERWRIVLHILRLGTAQLVWLGTPPHAAVNSMVELTKTLGYDAHKGLVNAVLKRVSREGHAVAQTLGIEELNLPAWLWKSWVAAYGEEQVRAIVNAQLIEPPLDISVKENPKFWADVLKAEALSTGSVRLRQAGKVTDLPGFAAGHWWVQDAAAALPAQLITDVLGKYVIDLCAAPGGKTAQLASKGARVTAVDRNEKRLQMLKENMQRLSLAAEYVLADVAYFQPEKLADAVLLDAPCTATGTLRRHPDVAHVKKAEDVARLAEIQHTLIKRSLSMLTPGGILVYCTCSLQPEEGEMQIQRILSERSDIELIPVKPKEVGGNIQMITADGMLRTLPSHLAQDGGCDGFFAARLMKK